jgi:hypothetical protein
VDSLKLRPPFGDQPGVLVTGCGPEQKARDGCQKWAHAQDAHASTHGVVLELAPCGLSTGIRVQQDESGDSVRADQRGAERDHPADRKATPDRALDAKLIQYGDRVRHSSVEREGMRHSTRSSVSTEVGIDYPELGRERGDLLPPHLAGA